MLLHVSEFLLKRSWKSCASLTQQRSRAKRLCWYGDMLEHPNKGAITGYQFVIIDSISDSGSNSGNIKAGCYHQTTAIGMKAYSASI